MGKFGLSSFKLISRGSSSKDVKQAPLSVNDWLEDEADDGLVASHLFINRPPPLDPSVERELRKACAVILQEFKPSGYEIEDTRMKSDELLDPEDDDPMQYSHARTLKNPVPMQAAEIKSQQHPSSRNKQTGGHDARNGATSGSTQQPLSSTAWVMDRSQGAAAPVNPHDFVVKPEPPPRSNRRSHQRDSQDTGHNEDAPSVLGRSSEKKLHNLPQDIVSPRATRDANEATNAPAPSTLTKSPAPDSQSTVVPSQWSPTSIVDDASSHYSRSSEHAESASTNLTSAPLTPGVAMSGMAEQSSKRASSPLPPVDADQINQIQTAMARRLRAQEAEMESHTSAARAVVVPSRNKARPDAAIVTTSDTEKPVIVSHRSASRTKSMTMGSETLAPESRSGSRASRRDGDAPVETRRSGQQQQQQQAPNAVSTNAAPEIKPLITRSGSGDSLERLPKGNSTIPPVPPLHEGRRANGESATFFRNSDGSMDGSFAKSKDMKLQGIKDKSEEPLQTARARIAASNSGRNSTVAPAVANQQSQTKHSTSTSQGQATLRQGNSRATTVTQPQSILKSPTQATFSIPPNPVAIKHHDDESIKVQDFYKPGAGGAAGKPFRYGANLARPRDGRKTDPAAADFDQLMSVMKDNKEVEPKTKYQPEIYNGTVVEEPEDEDEDMPSIPMTRPAPTTNGSTTSTSSKILPHNNNNVTIIEANKSSSRGPLSPPLAKSPTAPAFALNGLNTHSQSRTHSLTYSRTQSLLSNASQRIASSLAATAHDGPRKSTSSSHGASPFRVVSPTGTSVSGMAPSLYSNSERRGGGGVRKLFSKLGGDKKSAWIAPPAPSTIAIWEREMAEEEDPDWDEEACAAPVVGFGKGW